MKEILAQRLGEIRSPRMKTAVNPSDTVKYWRPAEYSSFDFVQAVCGFVGLVGVRYRSLCFQRFSFQHFSISALPSAPPISPPSNLRHLLCQGFLLRQGFGGQDGGEEGIDRQAGPTQWLFQEPPAESKFLSAADDVVVRFSPLDRLTGRPLAGDASSIRILHPVAGEMDIQLDAAIMLDFQPSNNFIDDWNSEF